MSDETPVVVESAADDGPLRQVTRFSQATVDDDWWFSADPRLSLQVNVAHIEDVAAGTSVDIGIASVTELQCQVNEGTTSCGSNWWFECTPEGVVPPEQTLPPGALSFGAAGAARLVTTFDCYRWTTDEHIPLVVDLTWAGGVQDAAAAGHFITPLPGPPMYLGAFPRRVWHQAVVGTASFGGTELVNASTQGAVIEGADIFVGINWP
jgi:hypothetical protein